MRKLLLIIHTLKHLRFIQIRFQTWDRVRKLWRKTVRFKYPISIPAEGKPLFLKPFITKAESYKNNTFTFLNLSKSFPGQIDWNYSGYGKLWTYNLNYFDFLNQENISTGESFNLILDFIDNLKYPSTALEPYPVSLRGINWIKFISSVTQHPPQENYHAAFTAEKIKIDSSLYAQYKILLDNLEYHLLGNHLLENGFSLLFGAFYFSDKILYNKARQIIEAELNEQILDDGAHFELSPMYHQIILDRLLDSINLMQNNHHFEEQETLLELMKEKAKQMLAWLNTITFSNGEIPYLNDSAPNIAPTTKQLNEYATALNFNPVSLNAEFNSSGYRKFTGNNYECIIDIGQIGPSYQPGHAHADTFNFVLNINNKPVIVDSGISTYDANSTRLSERGTAAHNTVTVAEKNSSQIWSAFRVAQRANVKILQDDKTVVSAGHNGYKKLKTTHRRKWKFEKDKIEITDNLEGKITEGTAHFWFPPEVNAIKKGFDILIEDITIKFVNAQHINIIYKEIPDGFYKYKNTTKIEISFKNCLTTKFITTH